MKFDPMISCSHTWSSKMIIQTDGTSCGPVALINAYYHKHRKYPKTSIRKLRITCQTDDQYGTRRWNLRNPDIATSLIGRKPTYDLRKIKKFEAFILLYSFNSTQAHYVCVTKSKCKTFYHVWNYYHPEDGHHFCTEFTPDDLVDLLRANPRIDGLDYPLAWKI